MQQRAHGEVGLPTKQTCAEGACHHDDHDPVCCTEDSPAGLSTQQVRNWLQESSSQGVTEPGPWLQQQVAFRRQTPARVAPHRMTPHPKLQTAFTEMCAHLHTAGSFWHGAWELPDELVPVLGEQHLALPYLPSEEAPLLSSWSSREAWSRGTEGQRLAWGWAEPLGSFITHKGALMALLIHLLRPRPPPGEQPFPRCWVTAHTTTHNTPCYRNSQWAGCGWEAGGQIRSRARD